jgi:hypothetical protein
VGAASVAIGLSCTLSTGLIAYFLGEQAVVLFGSHGVKIAIVTVALGGIAFLVRYLWQRRRFPEGQPITGRPTRR